MDRWVLRGTEWQPTDVRSSDRGEAEVYRLRSDASGLGVFVWLAWACSTSEQGVECSFKYATAAAEGALRYDSAKERTARHACREYVMAREHELTADGLELRARLIGAISAVLADHAAPASEEP